MNKIKTFLRHRLWVALASVVSNTRRRRIQPGFVGRPNDSGYGNIHYLPDGASKPRPGHTYRSLCDDRRAPHS